MELPRTDHFDSRSASLRFPDECDAFIQMMDPSSIQQRIHVDIL